MINSLQIILLLDSVACLIEMSLNNMKDFISSIYVVFTICALKLGTPYTLLFMVVDIPINIERDSFFPTCGMWCYTTILQDAIDGAIVIAYQSQNSLGILQIRSFIQHFGSAYVWGWYEYFIVNVVPTWRNISFQKLLVIWGLYQ